MIGIGFLWRCGILIYNISQRYGIQLPGHDDVQRRRGLHTVLHDTTGIVDVEEVAGTVLTPDRAW
jgi:hypothetical protein